MPSQYYPGSALVNQKPHEIPVAREFFQRLNHRSSNGPLPERFSPEEGTSELAGSVDVNKSGTEKRILRCREVCPEDIRFPHAAQVALIHRELAKHQPETVALITSIPRSEFDASAWLKENRQHLTIVNGLHLRFLVVSHNEVQIGSSSCGIDVIFFEDPCPYASSSITAHIL